VKAKRQQRRSNIGLALWAIVGFAFLVGVMNLTDPTGDGIDRARGILEIGAAVLAAYLAGRWREL